MKSGIKFKGRSSQEYGAEVRTKSRCLLPNVKSEIYSLPQMDGGYDFSDVNPYGRAFYDDRVFEITLGISADNICALESRAAKIASWLTGKGTLKLGDMSSVYKARVISDVAYTPELRGKKAELSVIFQAEAIGKAEFNTLDGIELENSVMLESDIPLDMSGYFNRTLRAGENTVKFVNIGDFYVRPKLIFDGAENLTVRFGDAKITAENLESDIIIDLEKCTVSNSDGDNLISMTEGRFFELPPGASELEIYTDRSCEMKIGYVPQTIYDFDFSVIDWGDGDA